MNCKKTTVVKLFGIICLLLSVMFIYGGMRQVYAAGNYFDIGEDRCTGPDSGDKWNFDGSVLTLNGVNLSKPIDYQLQNRSLTIDVKGTNTVNNGIFFEPREATVESVTSLGRARNVSSASEPEGLTIRGSAGSTLTINCTDENDFGICAGYGDFDIKIEGAVKIVVKTPILGILGKDISIGTGSNVISQGIREGIYCESLTAETGSTVEMTGSGDNSAGMVGQLIVKSGVKGVTSKGKTLALAFNYNSGNNSGDTGELATNVLDIRVLDTSIDGTAWTDYNSTTGGTTIPAGQYTFRELYCITDESRMEYRKLQFKPRSSNNNPNNNPNNNKPKEEKKDPPPAPKQQTPPAPVQLPDSVDILLNSNLLVCWNGETVEATWGIVPGVDTYEVWATYCGNNSFELITTVQGTNKAVIPSLKGSKLNTKKGVKVYIVAKRGGQVVGTSLLVHTAGPDKRKRTDAKSLKVRKLSYTIKVGKTVKLKVSTKKLKKGKKLLHGGQIRYASSNTSVATVGKGGKIKGVGAGTCEIWAYALNGRSVKVTVTVQ